MPEPTPDSHARLRLATACAAISPGLRSILLFDADDAGLSAAADALERSVRELTNREVARVLVPSAGHDDVLWDRLVPDTGARGFALRSRAGPLGMRGDATHVPMLVIPDLSRLELPAKRGLLAALDPDVVHLERHGMSRAWRPDAYCLAACERSRVPALSPHLLDRFALRLNLRPAEPGERLEELRAWLDDRIAARPSVAVASRAGASPGVWPAIEDAALELVTEYLPQALTHRRAIALARLAVALARLAGESPVNITHVDRAAQVTGVSFPSEDGAAEGEPIRPAAGVATGETDEQQAEARATVGAQPDEIGDSSRSIEVFESPDAEHVGISALSAPMAATPYPEDSRERAGELWSLKDVRPGSRSRSVPRGRIVGVQRTNEARDLALLATLLTAARWQTYREDQVARADRTGRLILWPSDFRAYRRAPDAERLLALVLDFTCLEGWRPLLLPHLRWAYTKRASVCLVRVGADDARPWTRADRLISRSLLDPRIDRALQAGPGQATPLAHGLALAGHTLRHGMHHGQSTVRQARLVVATDGRGNVPLHLRSDTAASVASARAGITDALAEASRIRELSSVEKFVLDPRPSLYGHLVTDLAEALGGMLVYEEDREERLLA